MSELNSRERALVGLGAALGSNCVPCAEHHIKLARAAGVSDDAVRAAIALADTIRQVPNRRVLEAAQQTLAQPVPEGSVPACQILDARSVDRTLDAMAETVSLAMVVGTAEPAARSAGGRSCC